MNIFDIFSPNTPAAAPQEALQPAPSPADPGNIPPATDPNAQAPNPAPAPAPAEPVEKPPMAEFSKLWENEPIKEGDQVTPPAPLDAAAIQKALANSNFAASVAPDTMTQIAAGGEEAQAAFQAAMNQVAQQVMTQSILAGNKLSEKAIDTALAKQAATIPDLVRAQQATSHLSDTNPLFNNPAIKPVVEATKAQILQKYPEATPAQVTEMTQNYITEMGKAFQPADKVNDNGTEGTDWDAFLKS